MPEFKVVIPARFESTRLPGKPMLEIAGKPMIGHVAERALESGAEEVLVATDHHSIFTWCLGQGIRAELTSRCHRSGTDRVAEIAGKKGWADEIIVVNLQGDEPLMPPENIRRVAEMLEADEALTIATLCEPVRTQQELNNPNVVKVVRDQRQQALYFSRAPIPWWRDGSDAQAALPDWPACFRHVGLYAYRAGFLRACGQLPPGNLEVTESLEQLRFMEAGYRIGVADAPAPVPAGVDTEEDLEHIRRQMEAPS